MVPGPQVMLGELEGRACLVEELPDAAIETAEGRAVAHSHEGLGGDALLEHVRSVHRLDAPGHLSRTTLAGLHDRLHCEADAAAR